MTSLGKVLSCVSHMLTEPELPAGPSHEGQGPPTPGGGEQTLAVSPEPQQHSSRPHSARHHILVQKTEVRGPAGVREGPHWAQSCRGSVSPEARTGSFARTCFCSGFSGSHLEASSTAGKTASDVPLLSPYRLLSNRQRCTTSEKLCNKDWFLPH